MWRDKQIEYTRLVTMSDPQGLDGSRYYQSFWELTRASLRYTLERLKLTQSSPAEEALMGQYAKLSCFAENLGVLQQLQAGGGMETAILSNGSVEMLESAVSSAGLGGLLTKVISVDGIRLFKTSPQSYGLVLEAFPVQAHEVLFVSSNSWDALGAAWFGFKTLWVNRQGLPFESIGPRPSYVGTDLTKVLEVVA
jgi:2-haloacid dehalogenase